jgi:TldD protein
MVTDVTYNAITTDFWANLDLIGTETWKMFAPAARQGSRRRPASRTARRIRIKKIMVGAAYA